MFVNDNHIINTVFFVSLLPIRKGDKGTDHLQIIIPTSSFWVNHFKNKQTVSEYL